MVVADRGGGEQGSEESKDDQETAPSSVYQEHQYSSSEQPRHDEEEERDWTEEEPMEIEMEEEEEDEEHGKKTQQEDEEEDEPGSIEDPSIHLHSAEERRALAYLLSNASNANTLSSTDHSTSQHEAHTPAQPTTQEQQQLEDVQNRNVETNPQPEQLDTDTQPSPVIPTDFTENSLTAQPSQDVTQALSQEPEETQVPAVPPNTLPSSLEGNQNQGNLLTVSGTEGHLHVHLDNPAFNTFNYWRTPILPIELPIPQIEVDIDISGQTTNVCVKAKVQEKDDTYQSQVNLTMATETCSGSPSITVARSTQELPLQQSQPHNTIEVSTRQLQGTLIYVLAQSSR